VARSGILILGLMLKAACASRGPQPTVSPIPSVAAATPASLPQRWRATLDTRAVGAVETVLWFDWAAIAHVTARSRAGALPVVVGRWRSLLARVFGADLGKGALLHLREGRLAVRNDSLSLDGRLVSPVFRLRVHAHVTEQRLTGTLTTRAGEPPGRIEAVPFDGGLPLRDYADLVPRMKAATAEHIYDPAILERSEWVSFWERLAAPARSRRPGGPLRRLRCSPRAEALALRAAAGRRAAGRGTGRATLVGERTAGAMLSSEEIPLGDGWTLLLPTADFYTPDGKRIEGRGVEPVIASPSARALEVALGTVGGESRL